jgi:hypothetical protein
MPYGVGGVESLRRHIVAKFTVDPLGRERPIQELLALLATMDLEQALSKAQLPENLERSVIRVAWQKVHDDDHAMFQSIVARKSVPHLEKLFRHLFDSTKRHVHVVTTNYDRLVEYSANAAGYGFTNAFSDGYVGTRAVEEPSRACRYRCSHPERTRVVHVWKVHGSVDWFSDVDGRVMCLPSATADTLALDPVIVTPGTSKYQKTHAEPFRTVIGEADRALGSAPSFLCVGYGFNDAHIHPKLTERVQNYNKPLIVLARALTPAAKSTLSKLSASYLAIEEGSMATQSRVYTASAPAGEEVPEANLWELGVFLDKYVLPSRS